MNDYSKLKGRLREKNLTQADLAREIGLAAATISQKLNGVRPITLEEAEKIAKFLDINDADFGAYFFSKKLA